MIFQRVFFLFSDSSTLFEDDVKPPPPPLGFEKAIDILSAWIHKKFFSESSESSTKSGSKEGRNTTSVKEVLKDTIEGSEESEIKTSTPERKNIYPCINVKYVCVLDKYLFKGNGSRFYAVMRDPWPWLLF